MEENERLVFRLVHGEIRVMRGPGRWSRDSGSSTCMRKVGRVEGPCYSTPRMILGNVPLTMVTPHPKLLQFYVEQFTCVREGRDTVVVDHSERMNCVTIMIFIIGLACVSSHV